MIALALLGGTVLVGVTTLRSSRQFSQYRAATLEVAPWVSGPVDVPDCIGFAVAWGAECPGIQSWCEAEVGQVAARCLASADRRAWCQTAGDAILTTGFGFEDCEARRADVEGTHARRWHKKYCAKGWRAVADHCRDLRAAAQ